MDRWPIKWLRLHKRRERKISEDHIEEMVRDLRANGQLKPIIADSRKNILDGAARYLAAKRLGWKTILVSKPLDGQRLQRGRRVGKTGYGEIVV